MFRTDDKIGPYVLVRMLGRGGFGEVWLAERRGKYGAPKVAVKLPLDELVNHDAIRHEANLWIQASGHENIVTITDADEYDGQVVIASEYVPGGSLQDWLEQNRQMDVERAVKTTIQILNGLEFLHSKKIIHRDLKPANILLQGDNLKLADFGISRVMRATAASRSQTITGTFAYMAPEALDGRRNEQTDIWSVGVNLYQFLTGTLPFPQEETSVIFSAIMRSDFEPLPETVPLEVRKIVSRALAKLPEDRYSAAADMRWDLQKYLKERLEDKTGFAVPPTRLVVGPDHISDAETVPPVPEPVPTPPKRPRPKWQAVGMIGIALAAIIALSLIINSLTGPAEKGANSNSNTNNSNTPAVLAALYIKGADEQCKQKKYAEATTNYREAIKLDPQNPDYYLKLGNCLFDQQKYSEAEPEYRAAVRLRPGGANHQYNLGNCLNRLEKFDEAIPYLKEAIRLYSSDADFYSALGNSFFFQKKYSEAIPHFQNAIRLQPDNAIIHNRLGECYYRTEQNPEAIKHYQEAVRLDASNGNYQNELGNAFYVLKRNSEAVAAYKEAVRLKPESAVIQNNLGNCLERLSKYREAETAMRKAVELEPSNTKYKADLDRVVKR